MKWKYYLRGLGIGMLVTALVLVLSGNARATMSDEAVKRRAAELGMVEKDKTVLNDIGEEAAEDGVQPQENPAEPQESGETEDPAGNAAEPEAEVKPADDAAKPADSAEESTETQEPEGNADTQAETPEAEEPVKEQEAAREIEERAEELVDRAQEIADQAPAGRSLTLEVRSGDSSVAVARRAAEAGLVQSAADFDLFLCRNGYDKRISVGSYEIIEGMTEKEIADIITKSR